MASFLPKVENAVGQKARKQKTIIKLLTPIPVLIVPRTTNVDQQNFNEESYESPSIGNTNFTPVPPVHDWRRATTDMNVSLRED